MLVHIITVGTDNSVKTFIAPFIAISSAEFEYSKSYDHKDVAEVSLSMKDRATDVNVKNTDCEKMLFRILSNEENGSILSTESVSVKEFEKEFIKAFINYQLKIIATK